MEAVLTRILTAYLGSDRLEDHTVALACCHDNRLSSLQTLFVNHASQTVLANLFLVVQATTSDYQYFQEPHSSWVYRVGVDGEWETLLIDPAVVYRKAGWKLEAEGTVNIRDYPPRLRYDYERALRVGTCYTRNLSGCWERDPHGVELPVVSPPVEGARNKELLYLTFAYHPSQALDLAPSDQVRVVKEMLGVTVDRYTAYLILMAVATDDWRAQRAIPELLPYLQQRYDGMVGLLLRDLIMAVDLDPEVLNLPVLQTRFVALLRVWSMLGEHSRVNGLLELFYSNLLNVSHDTIDAVRDFVHEHDAECRRLGL